MPRLHRLCWRHPPCGPFFSMACCLASVASSCSCNQCTKPHTRRTLSTAHAPATRPHSACLVCSYHSGNLAKQAEPAQHSKQNKPLRGVRTRGLRGTASTRTSTCSKARAQVALLLCAERKEQLSKQKTEQTMERAAREMMCAGVGNAEGDVLIPIQLLCAATHSSLKMRFCFLRALARCANQRKTHQRTR